MDNINLADALIIRQKKELAEILSGFETKNKYVITNPEGEELYWAAEKSSLLARSLLRTSRPFTVYIANRQNQTVLKLTRPFRLFFQEISISDPMKRNLGKIKQRFSLLSRKFAITDSTGKQLYTLYGPVFHPWTFKILKAGSDIGTISKQWSGLGKEIFTDADNFNITFPRDADLTHKSVLVGALFLMDMLYFEK